MSIGLKNVWIIHKKLILRIFSLKLEEILIKERKNCLKEMVQREIYGRRLIYLRLFRHKSH
jgi:hypothetical protein